MRKLASLLILVFTLSPIAMASDIAFYVGAPNTDGWYTVDAVATDVETIISQTGSLFASVQQFDDDQFDEFGAWVDENTNDGEMDILWLNGCMPSVLYPNPNLEPDGSRAELWLDGGNMIINVGDWFGYCTYEGGARGSDNGATGAANILDLGSGIIVSADGTTLPVTAAGQQYLPSLNDPAPTSRPIGLSAVVAPWEVAEVFAQDSSGAQADPVVIHNTETGGYVAFVNQGGSGSWIDDRGLTVSEFIKNWVNTVIGLSNPALAIPLNPDDESDDVLRDTALEWGAGMSAVAHDVYLGTSFDDVNTASRSDGMGILASEGQTATTYDPEGLLEFGTTYYWRIDEVNGAPDNTIFKGEIWSFTTEPFACPIENISVTTNATYTAEAAPENTINGSGLNDQDQHSDSSTDMFVGAPTEGLVYLQYEFDQIYKLSEMVVWNYNVQFESLLGFGFKNVTIEYSTDGEAWTTLTDAEFAQGTSKPGYEANTSVDFGGVAVKYVKLTANDRWGSGPSDQYGLSEVRFLYIPAHARQPEPGDGDTGVDVTTTLVWRGGRDAQTHEVYLGTDAETLSLAGTPASASYTADLNLDATYYWKVDETDADGVVWAGNLWSFSTQECLVIDDFESYDDEDNLIYETWEDGWVNGTGATVGYWEAPFAETSIVHGGSQAMPLFYDNTGASTSEANLNLGQDWAGNGIQSLSLCFQGSPANSGGQLYVKINNTKIPYDGDAAALEVAGWTIWSITLADTGANLSNVSTLTVGVEGSGAQGTLYIDDICLTPTVVASGDIGVDIAISTQAGWFGQDAADREIQEIINNVPAQITVFTSSDEDGLADWVAAHTGDGAPDLLILCGQFPDTIYGGANAEPDGSPAELFLDDGNTIINTGDYLFYVNTAGSNNAEAGIQNMMDIPTITMWDDDTAVTVTADGQSAAPSLQDFATDRPFHLDELEGDWVAELVLAQNADGTRADPVIVRNTVTGGRLGIFYQTSSQDDDPRGEVISEWINNWYVDAASGN